MIIFDGLKRAAEKETALLPKINKLKSQGINLKVVAVLFKEDAGSILYSNLKREVALRLGITYELHEFSFQEPVEKILTVLTQLGEDKTITGIIIQKPRRQTWADHNFLQGRDKDIAAAFRLWWTLLTSKIKAQQDVDGLHPTAESIVLPATAAAVLDILAKSKIDLTQKKIIILGKSDLLGQPLYKYFLEKNLQVEMIGSRELAERIAAGKNLFDADLIISATGRAKLITGDLLKAGVALIDVGEPKGDVDFQSVADKASFITPVPGGVGPMTVISLMENCVTLAEAYAIIGS